MLFTGHLVLTTECLQRILSFRAIIRNGSRSSIDIAHTAAYSSTCEKARRRDLLRRLNAQTQQKGFLMSTTDELINEAKSLPVELRAKLVDELLKSLNPSQAEIDELWAVEAEKRVEEIETGKVKTIPGEEVFDKLRKRLRQ